MCMGGDCIINLQLPKRHIQNSCILLLLVIAEPTIIFKITQIKYSEWGIKII